MTGRDRIVIVVVAVVVAIGAAWIMVVSPKRDQASKLEGQIQTAQKSLTDARSQLAQGEAARRAFRNSYATLVRLGEAVPTDDNVPSLIYEVQSAATKAGVDFQGLTLNPSAANGAPNVATPPASSTSASSSSSTTSAPTTTPTAPTSSTTGTATPNLPPGAVIGPAGFPIEPFTFTFQGNFFHLADFFARLQRFVVTSGTQLAVSGRLLNLNAISLGPAPQGFPQISATVSATTYLLPASQGLVDGATAAGPAGSTAPASGTAPTSSSTAPAPAVVTAGGG